MVSAPSGADMALGGVFRLYTNTSNASAPYSRKRVVSENTGSIMLLTPVVSIRCTTENAYTLIASTRTEIGKSISGGKNPSAPIASEANINTGIVGKTMMFAGSEKMLMVPDINKRSGVTADCVASVVAAISRSPKRSGIHRSMRVVIGVTLQSPHVARNES